MLLIAQQRWGEVGADLNVAERSGRVVPEQPALRVTYIQPRRVTSPGTSTNGP